MSARTSRDREALDHLDDLIQRRAPEAEFQRLFSERPKILSASLPLRLTPDEIVPLGRPGRSEPDFAFYPRDRGQSGLYGVVELKRPSTRILAMPRKGIVRLSGDAQTAVAQATAYSTALSEQLHEDAIILGTSMFNFVVLGLSTELANALAADLFDQQLRGLLPPSCQLIPYDQLRDRYEASLPPRILQLVPDIAHVDGIEGLMSLFDGTALYSPSYWIVSDEAVRFWSSVEQKLRPTLGGSDRRHIDRDRYVIRTERFRGHLASESDNFYDFISSITALIDELGSLGDGSVVPRTLQRFLAGAALIREGGIDSLGDHSQRVLRSFISQSRSSELGVAYETSEHDRHIEDSLERAGLIRHVWSDSGETSYFVHPLARLHI